MDDRHGGMFLGYEHGVSVDTGDNEVLKKSPNGNREIKSPKRPRLKRDNAMPVAHK